MPVIAIEAAWNALPRTPRPYSIDNTFIWDDLQRVADELSVSFEKSHVTNAVAIDLEGDGEDEWIVTATNLGNDLPPDAQKGDYALALLGRWIDAHPVHFIILSEIHTHSEKWAAPHRYDIRAVLDSNGDGNMEIFIHSRNYESSATSLHRLTDGVIFELLRAGWGH